MIWICPPLLRLCRQLSQPFLLSLSINLTLTSTLTLTLILIFVTILRPPNKTANFTVYQNSRAQVSNDPIRKILLPDK